MKVNQNQSGVEATGRGQSVNLNQVKQMIARAKDEVLQKSYEKQKEE